MSHRNKIDETAQEAYSNLTTSITDLPHSRDAELALGYLDTAMLWFNNAYSMAVNAETMQHRKLELDELIRSEVTKQNAGTAPTPGQSYDAANEQMADHDPETHREQFMPRASPIEGK